MVLVGHSYGGFVITNAAAGGGIRALVYVDAFIPDECETVFQILGGSGFALAIADPTTVLDIVGYPPVSGQRRRGVPETRDGARRVRTGPARVRPPADRLQPAPDHP
jgi:pimeloyl-ACP methyl ester carboxylesterase